MEFRASSCKQESWQGMVLRLAIAEGLMGTWVTPELLAVTGS